MKRAAWTLTGILAGIGSGWAATAQERTEERDVSQGYAVTEAARTSDVTEWRDGRETPVRLARFAFIEGDVEWRPDERTEWSAANINLPLRQEAQIRVGDGGRAEVQFDDGSVLRIGGNSLITLHILYSDEEGAFTEVKLLEGLTTLRLQHDRSVYQVDTPLVSVKAAGPARLRVGVAAGVEVAAQLGTATVEGAQGRTELAQGFYLSLPEAEAPFETRRLPRADSWERWNDERDARVRANDPKPLEHENSPAFLNNAADELEQHGTWRDDSQYGRVWVPRVTVTGWRPYHNGRWVWVSPFGWTWVSNEPWGWTPYHYGTWALRSYGWAWVPGPAHQPWCPAVVSFYDVGGSVAWVPLAPSEVRYARRISLNVRYGDWAYYTAVGQTAVYVPGQGGVCVSRPWGARWANNVPTTSIDVRARDPFATPTAMLRHLRDTPYNVRGGATLADREAFGGHGAFRNVPPSEAETLIKSARYAGTDGERGAFSGPTSIRPDAASVLTGRTTGRRDRDDFQASRRVFRTPLAPRVEQGMRDTAARVGGTAAERLNALMRERHEQSSEALPANRAEAPSRERRPTVIEPDGAGRERGQRAGSLETGRAGRRETSLPSLPPPSPTLPPGGTAQPSPREQADEARRAVRERRDSPFGRRERMPDGEERSRPPLTSLPPGKSSSDTQSDSLRRQSRGDAYRNDPPRGDSRPVYRDRAPALPPSGSQGGGSSQRSPVTRQSGSAGGSSNPSAGPTGRRRR